MSHHRSVEARRLLVIFTVFPLLAVLAVAAVMFGMAPAYAQDEPSPAPPAQTPVVSVMDRVAQEIYVRKVTASEVPRGLQPADWYRRQAEEAYVAASAFVTEQRRRSGEE